MSHVRTGAERLAADPTLAGGVRLGLITNPTGVLPDLTPTPDALIAAGVPLTALFGPEHGLRGTAQASFGENDAVDARTGLPVHDTYKHSGQALDRLIEASGVDTLLFDIADVGTRFYTYVWTMYDLLESAARLGVRFVVLDRPNPLGGTVQEGPVLDPAYASFVGRFPLPIRHGRTVGELATLFGFDVELRVVEMEGWRRGMSFAETGLAWVMPSVNMPTPDTALVYPGTGLFEGTNFSEGRGTTRPFELVGAPYVDERFAPALTALDLPGVRFRETWFTPTFHKHAGLPVRGVQLHVHDREAFRPVMTGLSMLHVARVLYPDDLRWAGPELFMDHLWGSGTLTRCLEAGGDPRDLCPPPGRPEGRLLYGDRP
ncbi:exo-beta-N-acetylmuramidase NamZ domain-containing protein [Nonomuraea purpurea]|uniref:Exo-beta-N-acetylmuramidase NamZ domain-containing protein n=1 Tax=Nonomuraea purpurea TaxID=1849276 RepID=A0ABV8G6C1_9ACTN